MQNNVHNYRNPYNPENGHFSSGGGGGGWGTELSVDKETLHRQRMSEQGLEGLTGASFVAQTVKYLPAMLKT